LSKRQAKPKAEDEKLKTDKKVQSLEQELEILIDKPEVFTIWTETGEVQLELYPKPIAYLFYYIPRQFVRVMEVTGQLLVFAQSVKQDPVTVLMTLDSLLKKDAEGLEKLIKDWYRKAGKELCVLFQLLFERKPYREDGGFEVLSEGVFHDYFTIPLMVNILKAFVKQNNLGVLVKNLQAPMQGK
jgi:hypothetical protein